MKKTSWYALASPSYFYGKAQQGQTCFLWLTVLLGGLSLWGALFEAPADYQQGEAFRMLYVHVPSAFMSLAVYSFIAVCALIHLVWRIKLADFMIQSAVPLGAWFTVLALTTGSLWGKPMWGTWWIWDARLTSELILLFLYVAILSLRQALNAYSSELATRGTALFILVGALDLPIIHYSVVWWNTLHQGPTLAKLAMPSMPWSMLWPLLGMLATFFFYTVMEISQGVCTRLLFSERKTRWVREILVQERS